MKIEWNRVTWYSKIIALVLFVVLPFIGFYYGAQYGEAVIYLKISQQSQATSTTSAANYYSNVATWQTAQDTPGDFSIAYPLDFQVNQNYSPAPTMNWRLGANGSSGYTDITITVPSAFEPQTNFADAILTVGRSGNNAAVAQCLVADPTGGPLTATSSAMINGIPFTVFQSSDAAAGSDYETTSYRTLHAGQCYAVEYTIHVSDIGNYPSQYDLHLFNEAMAKSVLDNIVGTFQFQ